MQGIRPVINLWSNSEPIQSTSIAWGVTSTFNAITWPRWFMASMARTKYVCIIDDDLILRDGAVLGDAISRLALQPPGTVVGASGIILRDGKPYRDSEQLNVKDRATTADRWCDLVKGEFMLMRTEELRACNWTASIGWTKEDDIAVCAAMSRGNRLAHVCLSSMTNRFTALDAPHALWRQPGHFERRTEACERLFRGYKQNPNAVVAPRARSADISSVAIAGAADGQAHPSCR